MGSTAAHWLVKSEPTKYAFSDLQRDGRTVWDGVRNNQAALHLKAMRLGDEALYYHSQEGLAVVGIAYLAFTYFVPISRQPPWLTTARTLPLMQSTGEVLLSLVPGEPHHVARAAPRHTGTRRGQNERSLHFFVLAGGLAVGKGHCPCLHPASVFCRWLPSGFAA